MRQHRTSLTRRVALAGLIVAGCGIITVEPDPSPAERKPDDSEPVPARRAGRGPGVCAMAINRAMMLMPTASDTGAEYHRKIAEYGMAMHEYHLCLASDSASTE